MFEGVSVIFPVAAVEVIDADSRYRRWVETADVDADSVGVRSRYVKRFDAADRAEMMLGDTGVEGVGGE